MGIQASEAQLGEIPYDHSWRAVGRFVVGNFGERFN